jgi:nucleoside-diphosphate-sugar epimerase
VNKTAVVTGSSGFIAGHLIPELEEHGYEVWGIDYDGQRGSKKDLRVPGNAEALIGAIKPDIVVHLAAKVGRLFGEDDVAETIADNAGMTALVAQAAGRHGARLVYASTSEVYGDNGTKECDEERGPFTLPHNAYGLSKWHGEAYCRLYAPDGFTALRFSMPFGPGLPAGRGRAAIINMLHQALHRQPITVHRGAERSWCWIGDTVRAARMVIELTNGGAFNVGRDDNPVPMENVARLACSLTQADAGELIELVDAPERQTVVKRLATKRIRKLGWEPTVDLFEGMELTLEWVKTLAKDGSVPTT